MRAVTGDDLLSMERHAAIFKAGQSALGHRWVLKDAEDCSALKAQSCTA
jgi:hypothetical protein